MIYSLRKNLFFVIAAIFIIMIGLLLLSSDTGRNKKGSMSTSQPTITIEPWKIQPTRPTQTNPLPTNVQKQGEADKNFANELKKTQTTYPWYNKLPLMDSNYFVYFDLNKKQLIAKIYSLSNNLSAGQVSNIKKQIESNLLGLGVPVSQFPILWQTGF
ncbi:hypothetical protein M1146_02675 [Patescibacteria group bacterium]|nr:hypothetical protein [Patescibacteria group bacterium]